MDDRYIDRALAIALGVVLLLVFYLLLTGAPARNRNPQGATLTETTTPTAPSAPTAPDTNNTNGSPLQAQPEAPTPAAPVTPVTPTTPTEAPTVVAALPEGGVPLNRIGFSFAGATGACNVPLEPWRHIAVSRDFLSEYGCGAEVTVILPETINGRDSFTAVIGDTMGPSAVRTINVYVSPNEPAQQYGLLEGGSLQGR